MLLLAFVLGARLGQAEETQRAPHNSAQGTAPRTGAAQVTREAIEANRIHGALLRSGWGAHALRPVWALRAVRSMAKIRYMIGCAGGTEFPRRQARGPTRRSDLRHGGFAGHEHWSASTRAASAVVGAPL